MENRFGFKDFVIVALLLVLIIMIGVKFVQDDRQWERLAVLETTVEGQGRDVSAVRRMLSEGNFAVRSGDGNNSEPQRDDIFRRIREIQRNPDYAYGDWLVDSFRSAPPTLNPVVAGDVYSTIIQSKVLETLAAYDLETLELTPLLARDWEVADDGLSVTFELRPNVLFSDGTEMTASDVVFSHEMATNPDIADGRYIQYYRRIEDVEALSDHEVRFNFNEVHYANVSRAAELPVLPEHFYEGRSDREIRESRALLLGTGPYRLRDPEAYDPGSTIQLVRNTRYWGEPGPWDRMVYRIMEQEPTQRNAFGSGDIDIYAPDPRYHIEMVDDEELNEEKEYHIYESVRSGYQYIAWNQKRGGEDTIFADKRVRQAMTMLVDRERIIDDVLEGFGRVATGPFHPLNDQNADDVEAWPYDPQQAMSLLEQVGFSREGESAPLIDPDGEEFTIELSYPQSELYERIALALRDNFARAGINLELNPQRWALLLQTLDRREFDAISLGWGAGGVESDIEQMFHSRTIEDGDNRNAYSNPEFDQLVEAAHVALDRDERMELWREAHRILHEDQPYTFLFFGKPRLWLDDRIKGVEPMPQLGINAATTWPVPMEWYVPEDLQERE